MKRENGEILEKKTDGESNGIHTVKTVAEESVSHVSISKWLQNECYIGVTKWTV